jgi:hypothetical protein
MPKATKKTKSVCLICGALWKNGKGFVEEHYFPCANDRYGWNFVKRVPINWERGGDLGYIAREIDMYLESIDFFNR